MLVISVTYFCDDRRTQHTWELLSVCCSRVSKWISTLSLSLSWSLNPVVQPGVDVAAALLPPSRARSCAAGRATAPASPPLLCLRSWCYVAPCWRPSCCTRTLCARLPIKDKPLTCVTAPTGSTSAGDLGSHLVTPSLSSPAAACGESGRSTRARMDSTAASHLSGWCPCRAALMGNCERRSCLYRAEIPPLTKLLTEFFCEIFKTQNKNDHECMFFFFFF